MTHMYTATADDAGEITVAISGECDFATRDALAVALSEALDRSDTVTADLAGVTFLDSSSLHVLIQAHHAADAAGKRLYVTGATGVVANVLDLTGVDDLLRRPGSGG
jgi:anti-sigma B factor antagonist